ncbi:hypothetical protein HGB13_04515 [bacterium]|nr:hypothetical protein [bacterium]
MLLKFKFAISKDLENNVILGWFGITYAKSLPSSISLLNAGLIIDIFNTWDFIKYSLSNFISDTNGLKDKARFAARMIP